MFTQVGQRSLFSYTEDDIQRGNEPMLVPEQDQKFIKNYKKCNDVTQHTEF
jgi:hypothetical protein